MAYSSDVRQPGSHVLYGDNMTDICFHLVPCSDVVDSFFCISAIPLTNKPYKYTASCQMTSLR